jgi:hypothetical protein
VLDDVLHRRGADELAVIARFLGEIVEGQRFDGQQAKAGNSRAASGEQVVP